MFALIRERFLQMRMREISDVRGRSLRCGPKPTKCSMQKHARQTEITPATFATL
jgi:hypothetical protein